MELLDKEDVEKIQSILDQQDENILNYTIDEIIKVPLDRTVGDIENNFPSLARDKDEIMYIYIVDEHDKLLGVINLKEILKSNDEEMLEDVMVDNVISLSPESTLKEAKLMFIRYGFRSIPVVDENEKILGVVTDKDIMTLKHRFLE
jgi:magnesium transporter